MVTRQGVLWGAVWCCLSLAFIGVAEGQADPLEGLRGPAFSDPSAVQEMPAGWEEQPIKYEHEVGQADVVATLNQQFYPSFLPIIRRYANERGLRIVVEEGTCGISAGMLARKEIDIGGFCCPPGETDRLPGLRFHTLGIVPIALLVHADNPVSDITLEQARLIFQGKIRNWSELGGNNIPIHAVGRLHCKLRPGHWRLLLDNEDLFGLDLIEVGSIPDMISLVSDDPDAIGFEIMSMVRQYKKEEKVKALKIDGHDPNGPDLNYPLYRALNITTWTGKNVENPHARELVDYLLEQVENLDPGFVIIPPSRLRQAGWKFKDNELIGEPD